MAADGYDKLASVGLRAYSPIVIESFFGLFWYSLVTVLLCTVHENCRSHAFQSNVRVPTGKSRAPHSTDVHPEGGLKQCNWPCGNLQL